MNIKSLKIVFSLSIFFLVLISGKINQINQKSKLEQYEESKASKTSKTQTDPKNVYQIGSLLIKRSEGLYLYPYYCPAGVLTIGWGHTYQTDKKNHLTTKGKQELKKHISGITANEAQELFKKDLLISIEKINKTIKPKQRRHLFSLTSLYYNAGWRGMYSKGTAVGKSYQNGNSDEDICERIKQRYVHNTEYEKGIKIRRQFEADLFSCDSDHLEKLRLIWLSEVKKHQTDVLNKYGITGKNRNYKLPINRRDTIGKVRELTKSEIKNLIK
jgi:GH24 family phage-related lysozyme (muramidase)